MILISRTRIIHSFFRPKTATVNKFRLLSFGKISFDRKILKAQNLFDGIQRETNQEATSMKHETPILTRVLYAFGVATIVIGVISGAVICADSLSEGIVVIIGSIFAGIIYIGIGQAVDFLARTAFSTDRVCTIMETSMLRLSKSIEIVLASTKPSAQKKNIPPPPQPSSPRPPAVYRFVLDGAEQGPYTHIDMRDFRSAGVVADDTPVFCDGETDWRTYRDFHELTDA